MSLSRSINFPKNMKAKDYIEIDGNFIYSGKGSIKTWGNRLTSNAINLPDNLPPGNYVLIIHVRYKGTVGTSSEIFKIKGPEPLLPLKRILTYSIFLIIIILLIISYLIYKRMNKKMKKESSIYKRKVQRKIKVYKRKVQRKIKDIKEDIESKRGNRRIKALEKAYAGGYVSKASYQKARKRIRETLKK